MKYLCLVYGTEEGMAGVSDDECAAWGKSLRKSGRYVAAEALEPVRSAITLRVRDDRVSVTDGPSWRRRSSSRGST